MAQIYWTNTHIGGGMPLTAEENLYRVEAAYNQSSGIVKGYQDEDYGFIDASPNEAEATTFAEAFRLWWNDYGVWGLDENDPRLLAYLGKEKEGSEGSLEDYEDVFEDYDFVAYIKLYNDGMGPHGIGGFGLPG